MERRAEHRPGCDGVDPGLLDRVSVAYHAAANMMLCHKVGGNDEPPRSRLVLTPDGGDYGMPGTLLRVLLACRGCLRLEVLVVPGQVTLVQVLAVVGQVDAVVHIWVDNE